MTGRALLAVLVSIAAASVIVAQAPSGRQSEGALQARPGADRQPEFPVPDIRQYKPKSSLVVPEHPTPRAKYPVIDLHSHHNLPLQAADFKRVVTSMDALNLRVLVNSTGESGAGLDEALRSIRASGYADRIVQFADVNFSRVAPGFGPAAARQLEADVKAGALGLGELSKNLGLSARKADGTRLKIDDPELDPIWETAARLNIPVLIHTADPEKFWEPIDYANERWLELALYANRRYQDSRFPSFETLMGERDRLFRRHPKTTFVAAHLGWHGNNLARLGKMLDEMPNLYTEVGAVLYDLGRQPRAAREFLVKYQDRVLFGKDNYQPDEFPYYWRTFETADEYFDYYRDYHAFWKLYGLSLPDEVLRKLYYQNALKIVPGMPRTGFPK
ncbi:MAG TPA: amidohydrolase family protein [Vicinamibacterales bacterium]|nr:amidohydrolase family protein [Vicinamibacterales bacterium]